VGTKHANRLEGVHGAGQETRRRGVTFTFDTGMRIAIERRKPQATEAFRAIVRRGILPVVPAANFVRTLKMSSPGA
jgi:hypothetical protein